MAKETYYFSHDSNAITDTKILNMRADYGLEGYGLFWAIIEMMRNEESYKLQADKKIYRAIKTLTNTNIDVEKYVQDCINEYELFKEDNGYFFSNSLLKRMLEKVKQRKLGKGKEQEVEIEEVNEEDVEKKISLLQSIKQRYPRFHWWAEFHVKGVQSLELIQKLKDCGCVHMKFGVEMGNQDMLDTMNKNIEICKRGG